MTTEATTNRSRKLGIAVPADLHRKAKAALAYRGLTFQEVCEGPLVAVLTAYATGKKRAADPALGVVSTSPRGSDV